jgi:hypothetical protein
MVQLFPQTEVEQILLFTAGGQGLVLIISHAHLLLLRRPTLHRFQLHKQLLPPNAPAHVLLVPSTAQWL